MTGAVVQVVRAGPLVSVQDGGRPGHLRHGVPASGAMDRLALRAANRALGNPEGAAAIEVSLGGLELTCLSGQTRVAIAGGGFVVQLGEQRLGSWCVVSLAAGDRLTIRRGTWGSWCYLAFSGGLETNLWLGSAATLALSGLGGGMVQTGDQLRVAGPAAALAAPYALPCPVMARPRHHLRVTLGPQDRYFESATLQAFLSQPFSLTDAYDRMGVRLRGPALPLQGPPTMPSEPILRGSVQVAADGVATVLLADHQTTGGYPKIATVLDADLDAFTQLRRPAMVGFDVVTPAAAITIARLHHRAQSGYLQRLDALAG